MKASLGGQIVIALGGLVSAFIIIGVLSRGVYVIVRYIQWMNLAIIYCARKTGTPLPKALLEQYHELPHNGKPLDHVLIDSDPVEPDGEYPLPPRKAKAATANE